MTWVIVALKSRSLTHQTDRICNNGKYIYEIVVAGVETEETTKARREINSSSHLKKEVNISRNNATITVHLTTHETSTVGLKEKIIVTAETQQDHSTITITIADPTKETSSTKIDSITFNIRRIFHRIDLLGINHLDPIKEVTTGKTIAAEVTTTITMAFKTATALTIKTNIGSLQSGPKGALVTGKHISRVSKVSSREKNDNCSKICYLN